MISVILTKNKVYYLTKYIKMRESYKKYLMKNYTIEDINYFDKQINEYYVVPKFVKDLEMDVSYRKLLGLYNKTQSEKKVRLFNLKNSLVDSEKELEKHIYEINMLDFVSEYKNKVFEARKDIVFKLNERKYYMSHHQYTKYLNNLKYTFQHYIKELRETELQYALKENSYRISLEQNIYDKNDVYEIEKELLEDIGNDNNDFDSDSSYSHDSSTM